MSSCSRCHSETEQTLELKGQQVHIRFACFRDLGRATERSAPKWRCLLRTGTARPPLSYTQSAREGSNF
ncbi:hypothetical protein F5B18DRAFT_615948, partial [Nemania serpens]